jgi:ATP-dependent RNA helicase RhlB
MEFKELNLHPDLQRGIAEAEYNTCMPVQEQVLRHAFSGQDLYVQSQTGTGKTAAFLIVIFQRLLAEDQLAGKKALIMAPTRELAVQIEEEAKMLAKYLPFKIGSFYGGVGYTAQQQLLKDNAQILVGTPGRVLDLNKSGRMNLMEIAFLVLDEADRMFDMGFYPDLRKLIRVVPPADRRQTMLFSATLNAWVKNLAWEYTKSPFEIEIEPETVTVEEVDQILYHVPSEEKMRLLLGILEREQPESAVIFCNTKRYTEIVAKRLELNGHECEFIIGDLPQARRLKVIDDVKAGKVKFLVATDVAARGLDIEGLSMVINYDLPVEAENYVHRIGRTARAGKTGRAITLASEQDVYELPAIERYIGKKIPSEIATPDLHAEDKSAGAHIRTEFYEDRREERRPRGGAKVGGVSRAGSGASYAGSGASHTGSGGREARPYGDSRGRKRESRGDGRSAEKRGPSVHGPMVHGPMVHGPAVRRQRGQGRDEGKTAQSGGEKDLSGLSFEERMAYYKQKYDAAAVSGNDRKKQRENAGGERREPPQGAGRRDRKKRRGNSAGAANTPQQGAQGGAGKKAAGASKPSGKKSSGGGSAREQDAPRKGVLSRLLGIFRKKDQGSHNGP